MNILVTGGASGLGRAITEKLCEKKDNKVYFTYHSSAAKAEEIEKLYANAKGIKCDFTDKESVSSLGEQIAALGINILVNNAFSGKIEKKHFHKTAVTTFEAEFAQNIIPLIQLNQQAITFFRKNKFGKIITVLSSAIINRPPNGWSGYSAGKAYVHSLAKSWAIENAAYNITSNCISPSFMQTALTNDTDERIVEEIKEKHPLKSILKAEEVAEAVAYFAGCSQQVNGTNLIINAAADVI